MSKKQVAIFRTKDDIILAMAAGNIKIAENVQNNPVFISADKNELLGFKLDSEIGRAHV